MNRFVLVSLLLAAVGTGPVLACGESMFNTGKGLEFQAYLAPRPATVVIYGTPDPSVSDAKREQLLAGLKAAGHRVVLVDDVDAYTAALQSQKVDLVIADAGAIDGLAGASSGVTPRLVPVLARGASATAAGGGRFELVLRAGARVGE
jgi:hypothetical protein